jgi:sugar O-acyltransferase (sialic acid O-acetyltransferase NeuD family)
MKKALIGAGGFAREIAAQMKINDITFFVDDVYWEINNKNILPLSKFNPENYEVLVAIGDPNLRSEMVKKLPTNTKYFSYIHNSAQLLGDDIDIGEGSIICAGCILTTNIKIDKHCHLNLNTTIGHDCTIGKYFTTAPGVNISGNCKIENMVYIGTNASVKQGIYISDSVTIGMNGAVVKNVNEPGTYVGVPVTKIK